MSRYIDADAFLKEYCEPYPYVYKAMSKAMADAPSIDICFCKECRYRKNRIDYKKDYCIKHSKVLYDTDGGCSWGKE